MKLFQRLAAFDCKQKSGRCNACGKGAARMLCGVKNPDFFQYGIPQELQPLVRLDLVIVVDVVLLNE